MSRLKSDSTQAPPQALMFSLLPRGTFERSLRPPLPLTLASSAVSCSFSLCSAIAWAAAFSRTACSSSNVLSHCSVANK